MELGAMLGWRSWHHRATLGAKSLWGFVNNSCLVQSELVSLSGHISRYEGGT